MGRAATESVLQERSVEVSDPNPQQRSIKGGVSSELVDNPALFGTSRIHFWQKLFAPRNNGEGNPLNSLLVEGSSPVFKTPGRREKKPAGEEYTPE